jgi:hypothetical protein
MGAAQAICGDPHHRVDRDIGWNHRLDLSSNNLLEEARVVSDAVYAKPETHS